MLILLDTAQYSAYYYVPNSLFVMTNCNVFIGVVGGKKLTDNIDVTQWEKHALHVFFTCGPVEVTGSREQFGGISSGCVGPLLASR